jgi:putative ABC transport system permease protein
VARQVSCGRRSQPWAPSPKFFDLNNGSFEARVCLPPVRLGRRRLRSAATRTWKAEAEDTYQDFLNSECVWLQFWVELPTAADRERYQAFVDNYARSQKAAGRMQRPLNNRLYDVEQWLDRNEVVQRDNRVLIGIALLFLGVCLVNVVGLLLAKFLNAAPLTGLRRAGRQPSRVRQHDGGGADHAPACSAAARDHGLAGIRALYGSDFDRGAHGGSPRSTRWSCRDLGLSLLAGAVAGLYPSWRIGRTAPAVYLKTQ